MVTARPLNILLFNQAWFRDELRGLGHRVLVAGYHRPDYDVSVTELGLSVDEILTLLPPDFIPDRIFVQDNSGIPWFTGLESTSIPSVFLSVDTHHHHNWHKYYANLFDHVLVAQKQFITPEYFSHPSVEWFPLWAQIVPPAEPVRDIDICFRGTMDPALHRKRARWFADLEKFIQCDAAVGPWELAYPRAKIVLNQNVLEDLNFRNFEALISGALLFTPRLNNGILDLFTDGEEIVTYDRSAPPEEIAARLRYFLEHDAERTAVAERGHKKALKFHTAEARAARLSELMLNLEKISHPLRNLSALRSALTIVISQFKSAGRPGLISLVQRADMLIDTLISKGELPAQDSPDQRDAFLLLWFLYEVELYERCTQRAAQLKQCDPDNASLYTVYELAALLALNRSEEALAVAATASPTPKEFLWSIPELLNLTRRTLEENFSNPS